MTKLWRGYDPWCLAEREKNDWTGEAGGVSDRAAPVVNDFANDTVGIERGGGRF